MQAIDKPKTTIRQIVAGIQKSIVGIIINTNKDGINTQMLGINRMEEETIPIILVAKKNFLFCFICFLLLVIIDEYTSEPILDIKLTINRIIESTTTAMLLGVIVVVEGSVLAILSYTKLKFIIQKIAEKIINNENAIKPLKSFFIFL